MFNCWYFQNITAYFWLQIDSVTCLLFEYCCWISWWFCLGLELVCSCWYFPYFIVSLIMLPTSIVLVFEVVSIICLFSQSDVRVSLIILASTNHVSKLMYCLISHLMVSAHSAFETEYLSPLSIVCISKILLMITVKLYILCFSVIPS